MTRPTRKAPIASDTPTSSANPAYQHDCPEERDREDLVLGVAEYAAHVWCAVPRHGEQHGEEEERGTDSAGDFSSRGRFAQKRGEQGQVEREEHVLLHDHTQNHRGFAVREQAGRIRQEVLEVELQAQVEQQQDQSECGQQLQQFRPIHDDRPWHVGTQQQPCSHEERDGRQAQAAEPREEGSPPEGLLLGPGVHAP